MHPVRTSGWRCLIYAALPQHFLNFLPEPQGHGSLRPTLVGVRAGLVDDPDGSGIDLLRSLSPRVGGDRGAGWRIWSNNRAGNLPARQRSVKANSPGLSPPRSAPAKRDPFGAVIL